MLVSRVLPLSKVERPLHSLKARQVCPGRGVVSSDCGSRRGFGLAASAAKTCARLGVFRVRANTPKSHISLQPRHGSWSYIDLISGSSIIPDHLTIGLVSVPSYSRLTQILDSQRITPPSHAPCAIDCYPQPTVWRYGIRISSPHYFLLSFSTLLWHLISSLNSPRCRFSYHLPPNLSML